MGNFIVVNILKSGRGGGGVGEGGGGVDG